MMTRINIANISVLFFPSESQNHYLIFGNTEHHLLKEAAKAIIFWKEEEKRKRDALRSPATVRGRQQREPFLGGDNRVSVLIYVAVLQKHQ